MTKDKIQAARDNGYSDDEIAQYLSSSDDKFKQAIESGYSVDEIANHLGQKKEIKSGPESEPQVEVQPSEEGPSAGRIAGGLAAEIAAAEGLKYAGSFAGPWGYAAGATAGGITGSILAQEIENPNKPISWGRVVADTALNFIPGQKLLKGGKATTKVGKALVGTGQVAARGAVGSAMATGAQAVEKGIEEQRMLTAEEAKTAAGTGFALGGGLEIAGKAFKAFSPQAQKLFQKSPKEVDDLVKAGDADTIKAIDEIVNVSGIEPEELASKNDEEFVKKVIDREQAPKLDVIESKVSPTQEIDVESTSKLETTAPKETAAQTVNADVASPEQKKSFYDRYLEDEVLISETDPRFPNSIERRVGPGGFVNVVNQKNLSELTDKDFVYHETNLKNIRSIVSRLKQGPRSSNLWVSDSIDLALGQGGNGYIVKLNPKFINGSKTQSLSNQIMGEIGSGKFEYNLTKTLPNSVSSIIAPSKKGVEALKKTKGFDKIFDFNDVKEVDGKFEIPARIKKQIDGSVDAGRNKKDIDAKTSYSGEVKPNTSIVPASGSLPKLEDNIQNAIDYENYPIINKNQFIDVEATPQQREITTEVTSPKEFEYDIPEESSIAKSISQLTQGFKSRFAPSLVTGGKTIAAEAKKAGAVSEAGRTTGAILEAKINRIVSKSKNPEEANRLAYEFVNGKIDELPVDLKKIEPDLLQGRKWVGKYQDELLQNHYNGQRPLEETLLREIERSRNDGDYLTKPYLFFESASYKPSKQQEAALKGALVRNGMTRGDADVYINQLNAKRADGPDDVSNFVFQSPAGILKKRKDLIPELRGYLGEVTETGSILSATMSKLSRINAYDTSDFNIKTTLRDLGIAKTKNDGIAPTDQPLNLRRTPKLRPDQPLPEDQLYVPIEVQRAINSLYGADLDNNGIDYTTRFLADMIGTGGSLSSAAKTVFSPFSYSVQPLANFVLSATAGGNPFKGLGRGIKYGMMQYKPIASRMGIGSVAEFKRRKELNVIGQGLIQGNLEAGLKGPKLGAAAQKVVKPFGVAYSLADTAFRIPVYESNLGFLNKVVPAFTSKEFARDAEEMAASMTNLTYPNYDYASTALKTMSRWQALLSAYATFPLEVFRTAWNQGKLSKKMIDGSMADFLESKYGGANRAYGSVNREAIRKEGMARFARLAAALSAPVAGINLYNRHVGGVSEEEEKAIRESVSPDYNEYNPNAIHKTKDGKYYETNISYTAPFSDISSIFMAGARGEDFQDSLGNAIEAFKSKIIGGESFFLAPLMAAAGNYIPRADEKISDKVGAIPNLLERTGWFAGKVFTSGLQREIENATRAYNPTTAKELALKAVGLRTKLIDPVEGVGFRLRDVRSSLNSISSKYKSATYNMAGQDLEDEYNNQNRVYQDNFNLISKHIKNMRTIGFPKEKIIQVMVDNGIGRRNTLLAINGYTPSIPKIKEVTPSSEWDRISQLPASDQINAIKEIEDIDMRKKIFSLRKNDLVDKRRGITEEDRLWKSLEEKEQIDIALDMMKNHNDPDAVLRGLIRKGQVSPRTSIDIKKRFQAEKVLAR